MEQSLTLHMWLLNGRSSAGTKGTVCRVYALRSFTCVTLVPFEAGASSWHLRGLGGRHSPSQYSCTRHGMPSTDRTPQVPDHLTCLSFAVALLLLSSVGPELGSMLYTTHVGRCLSRSLLGRRSSVHTLFPAQRCSSFYTSRQAPCRTFSHILIGRHVMLIGG